MLILAVTLCCSGCAAGTGLVERLTGAADAARGPSLLPPSHDYYPSLAKQQGLSGRVGLECSVDGRGHAQDIVILESGGLILDDAAVKAFSDGGFLIPPDWSASGGPARRFRYGVIFQLQGRAAVPPFEDHRLSVVITASGN
jgi:TonB family protein